jgi:putative peptidoglycan lipid II flippase
MTTPRKAHTVGSAAVLLMASALLSGVLGLIRIKYVNLIFGAGPEQDAYRAAFALPDLLAYFLIGGAASISIITILNRYREAGDDEGADRALSVILTNMVVVLTIGVLLGEILAPQYVWLANKGFRNDPTRFNLCVTMTRIILPAQIFLFIGSAMGSRLQVRKIFIYQACAPLIYNLCIILGAVFFHRTIGISSLALGVFVGFLLGYALLSSLGAFRTGLRYTPTINFRAPAFQEWFKLSLPLMVGVSLVMFDRQFLNYFASVREGGITLIGTAKDLFNAPFNVIGPAAGAASLPFFASLFQQKKFDDFSRSVSRSVSRLFAVAMLVSAWMIALAPWLMDLFRGGRFNRADAAATTQLFVVLAIRHRHHRRVSPGLLAALPHPRPARLGRRVRHRHHHPDPHPRHPAPPQTPRPLPAPRVRRTRPLPRRRSHRLYRHLWPRPPAAPRHHPHRRPHHHHRWLPHMADRRLSHPSGHRQQTASADSPPQIEFADAMS